MAAFAQIQRRQISEMIWVGLAAAKARRRLGGRPTMAGLHRAELAGWIRAEGKSFDDPAALSKVEASTVKRALRDRLVPAVE